LTPREVSCAIGKPYDATKQMMKRLADDRLLVRRAGSYGLPPDAVTVSPPATTDDS
jgi:hypothetical protein